MAQFRVTCNRVVPPIQIFFSDHPSSRLSTAASLNLRRVDFQHFRAIWELAYYCAFRPACRYPYPGFATRLFRRSFLNPSNPFPWNEWTGLAIAESERCFAIVTLARGSTGFFVRAGIWKSFYQLCHFFYFSYRRTCRTVPVLEENINSAIILRKYIPTTARHWCKHALHLNKQLQVHELIVRRLTQVRGIDLSIVFNERTLIATSSPIKKNYLQSASINIFTLHFNRTITNR